MDPDAVRAAYDEQIRRRPDGDAEHEDGVVRVVGGAGGWLGVTWSDLDETTADAAIAAQVARFAAVGGGEWEWKHHSHDRPADLPRRLLAAGFTAEPAETLMVAEIAALDLDVAPPPGIELREAADEAGVAMLVRVHEDVFGEDHSAIGRELLAEIRRRPPGAAGVVALAGEAPVCAGRVVFHAGTEFASLWGDGTLPEWRGRGIMRSLVAWRARLAAERGFRYLQADALPASRPIFARLGFAELATTTPFVHPGR